MGCRYVEKPLNFPQNDVADQNHDKYGGKTGQQVEVLEQDRVACAANHAQAGSLRQRADDQGNQQGNEQRRILGARPGFGEGEECGERRGIAPAAPP